MKKPYSKRRKMWNRIISGPTFILIGGWSMLQTSFAGAHPGELIIPWQTSPIWLFGLLIGSAGLYILALPLIRRGWF